MTEARVDLPTEKLTKGIFISTSGGDRIRISCNWCSTAESKFYEGDDVDSCDTDWLGPAIKHLAEKHPTNVLVQLG